MPRISVVMAAYNQARFVGQAIDSILAQTTRDWELIVVDDGSTDDTSLVVARYADPRIRYIYEENQGVCLARNTGIDAAAGVYLALIDADDTWHPNFLERCASFLDGNSQVAGVYTLHQLMDEEGAPLPQSGGRVVARGALRSALLEGGSVFALHAALTRTSAIRAVGKFAVGLTLVEDWDLWLRFSAAYELEGIAEALAYYRIVPTSASTRPAPLLRNRVTTLTRHFGPPEGDPVSWIEDKRRAYAFAYRVSAFEHIQQGRRQEGWRLMDKAVALWPAILERLDTYYELACGDQPRGFRGSMRGLDLRRNADEMIAWLRNLFASQSAKTETRRHVAYGCAYLALAMLSERNGDWSAARRHLVAAIRANPRLLTSGSVLRRASKLCAGQAFVGRIKTWRTLMLGQRR